MIGRLRGQLVAKNPPQILIDVAGVGYEVDVPMSTFCNLPELGANVMILTHLVTREDAQLLYGFLSEEERTLFRALIKISGIGPRIGLAILSGMNASDLVNAIENGESGLLTRIPGIGKKTAERLVLELKGKLLGVGLSSSLPTSNANHADIISALVALGYSEREAQSATKALPPETSVSDGIRLSLQHLTR